MTAQDQQSRAMVPGDELHLSLLMAPHGLNLVSGQDRAHLLAYARDVWQAARAMPAGMAPVAEIENGSLRWHIPAADYSVDVKRLTGLHQLFTAAQVLAMGRVPPATKVSRGHAFRPHAEYPWFCADCGYAPHDELMHTAAPRPPAAQKCTEGCTYGPAPHKCYYRIGKPIGGSEPMPEHEHPASFEPDPQVTGLGIHHACGWTKRAATDAVSNEASAAQEREPLDQVAAMKLGMAADDATRKHCRGTTNWAHALTRFYEKALERMPTWEPKFDVMAPRQEELAVQFCNEISGPLGKPGRAPDPVRLLEMADELYKAERDAAHCKEGGAA